jgi:hypothetical protein
MAKRVSIKQKRRNAPEWVFPWRPLGGWTISKWSAVLIVGGVFALFLSSVRIRLSPLEPWAAKKAAVIHVSNDAEGRALTLRASEGGPFPSRFEPASWEGAAALEQAAFEELRWTPPPYVPALRDLPESPAPPLQLSAMEAAVLPKRRAAAAGPPPGHLKPTPTLYPLSGITVRGMPQQLPPFDGTVSTAMTAEAWRFLLRLDAAGLVRECVSLSGGDETGAPPLENWLRHVAFPPDSKSPTRWIAVGVGFVNQPATPPANGTDTR